MILRESFLAAWYLLAVVLAGLRIVCPFCEAQENAPARALDSDLVVVGSGISGLCTAIEAGRAGASVTVIDMWSVFGGHGVLSSAALCLVDTPMQRSAGIADSPELATRDFLKWGEDAHPGWVRLYTEGSRERVHDWLLELGVEFSGLDRIPVPGNSVIRIHQTRGRGMGLMGPLYLQCLHLPNVRFIWNTKAVSLTRQDNRVAGVLTEDVRTGQRAEVRGRTVVLATGGFQSNLDLVRSHWPALPQDARMLRGAGINAVGSGLEIAGREGARIERLDHQWNYAGTVSPADPLGKDGIFFLILGIDVNRQGRRFVNEFAGHRVTVDAMVRQPGATQFKIFGSEGAPTLWVAGTGWDDTNRISREILNNPALASFVKRSETLEGLARQLGIEPAALVATVDRWNQAVDSGVDAEFGRDMRVVPDASRIRRPPFYSIQCFPLPRKSLGGVAVNLDCQVLDRQGTVIPGLYAVGELTGFGGINGRAALEGTMLGPSILMGRIAGGGIARTLGYSKPSNVAVQKIRVPAASAEATPPALLTVMRGWLRQNLVTRGAGFDHFKKSHTEVLDRGYDCRKCHAERVSPMALSDQSLDRRALTAGCVTCHSARE